VRVIVCGEPDGRASLAGAITRLAREKMQSVLIEAGSQVNAAALAGGHVDRVFFYYAPKIFFGQSSLPLAAGLEGGPVRLERVQVHSLGGDEFAVEGYVRARPKID
jgi:riboflavin biosynthesis pyrimidine reductase